MSVVAAHKGYAYVLNGWTRGDGVLIFDVRNPKKAGFMQGFPGAGYLTQCAFRDSTMYLATRFSLMVVDVSNPETPRLIRNMLLDFPGMAAQRIAVDGDRLLIGGAGLRVMDISEPTAPVPIAYDPRFNGMTGLAAYDGVLVITTRGGGTSLATFRDDKLKMHSVMKLKGPVTPARGTLINATKDNIDLYDIHNPDTPVRIKQLPTGRVLGVTAAQRLMVLQAKNRLITVDLSDIENPKAIRIFSVDADLSGPCALESNRIYSVNATAAHLEIVELADGVAKTARRIPVMRGEGNFEIHGSRFYCAYSCGATTHVLPLDMRPGGMTTFLSDTNLTPCARERAFGVADVYQAGHVERIGDYLLAGDGLVDISNPNDVIEARAASGPASEAFVGDNLAVVAQHDRITFLDISQLPNLGTKGVYRPGGDGDHFTDVFVHGNVLYALNNARGNTRIQVLDIGNPQQPELKAECAVPPAIVFAGKGDCLYVPTSSDSRQFTGMVVVDVSDSSKPAIVKRVDNLLDHACYRIKVHGDYLYFTDSMRGIKTADISDPDKPVLVRTYKGATDVALGYTDFEIHDRMLYGLRHSRIDVWKLLED